MESVVEELLPPPPPPPLLLLLAVAKSSKLLDELACFTGRCRVELDRHVETLRTMTLFGVDSERFDTTMLLQIPWM